MDHDDWLTDEFQANRPRLRGVAYRMLGTRDEAEDAVQDTWLRLARTDSDGIENLGGWLTTVIARICLDRLRARTATASRVTVVERPEDIPAPAGGRDPEHEALVADSVGAALLVVLDALPPAGTRARSCCTTYSACPSTRSARWSDEPPTPARQLASRARRRVQDRTPAAPVDLVHHRDVVQRVPTRRAGRRFRNPRASPRSRRGARARRGCPTPGDPATDARCGRHRRVGRRRCAQCASRGGRRHGRSRVDPGRARNVRGAMECDIVDGRIVAMRITGDPERLAALDVVLLDD